MRGLVRAGIVLAILCFVVPNVTGGGGPTTAPVIHDPNATAVCKQYPAARLGAPITADPGQRKLSALACGMLRSGHLTVDNGPTCAALPDFVSGQMYWKGYRFAQEIIQHFSIHISCLWTDHPVDGLYHPHQMAFDINYVNGEHVLGQGPQSASLTRWLYSRANADLPFEVGVPPRYLRAGRLKGGAKGPFLTELGVHPHFHFAFECIPGQPADFSNCFKVGAIGRMSTKARLSLYQQRPWM